MTNKDIKIIDSSHKGTKVTKTSFGTYNIVFPVPWYKKIFALIKWILKR